MYCILKICLRKSNKVDNPIHQEEHQGMLNYTIPKTATVTWSKIFSLLENNKELANIADYSVSQTTLEQVFLSFARAQREDDV